MFKSITREKIAKCVIVLIAAAISLGFCIGKSVENSLEKQDIFIPNDYYKMDLVQTEVNRK